MTSEHLATIPSIAERMNLRCETCVWEDGEYGCQAASLGYIESGGRNDWSFKVTYAKRDRLPCRFHLTPDELKQILDPYFME